VRGRTLPFVRRYGAGAMFIGVGMIAATATASTGSTSK
jgi:hypothetical protein